MTTTQMSLAVDEVRAENAAYRADLEKKVQAMAKKEGVTLQKFDPEMLVRRGVYLVLITPDDAAYLLEQNKNNRRPKRRAIAQYARDMLAAEWNADASVINVDRHLHLQDGQNRCMACIESGAPFPTLLRTGVDPDAKNHIDQGVKRTAADTLMMAGFADPNHKATAVNIRMRYERIVAELGGRLPQSANRTIRVTMTHAEVLDYIEAHPQIDRMGRLANQMREVGPGVPKTVYIAALSMFAESSEKMAREFAEAFIEGTSSGTGDPLLALARYLARAKSPSEVGRRSRNRNLQHLLAFVQAWNAWVQSEKIDRIQIKDTDLLVPAI